MHCGCWTLFIMTFMVVTTNSLPAYDFDLFDTDDHDIFAAAQPSAVNDWNLDSFINIDDLAIVDSNASLYDAKLEAPVPNATSRPWDDSSTAWNQDLLSSSAASDSCDTSNKDLQRRAKFCRPNDVQIRPLSPEEVESGTKVSPPDYKRAICPTVRLRPGGWDIALHIHAMCDTGDIEKLAPFDEVPVLEDCTPCMYWNTSKSTHSFSNWLMSNNSRLAHWLLLSASNLVLRFCSP